MKTEQMKEQINKKDVKIRIRKEGNKEEGKKKLQNGDKQTSRRETQRQQKRKNAIG